MLCGGCKRPYESFSTDGPSRATCPRCNPQSLNKPIADDKLEAYEAALLHIAPMVCFNVMMNQPIKTVDKFGRCACISCTAKNVLDDYGVEWRRDEYHRRTRK